ncbi:hypothetical protein CH372_17055 [Leptospira meyeri]|uniref:AAA family ATPase n=1 Tax=Leptospira meyeri TaxID=29508 RepID=UPI000C2A0C14|nr:AAA family ATPase [Leptospira meyeri]PKA10889.1 hypothetical protein CH372_17055 [Leptospira meyeri]PKA25089.1 hypothetical protein CH381_17110 [Leptospira sp. mixed culture ATI2-C-A1]
MIRKIKSIQNLAVFHDFEWDKSVIEEGRVREFNKNNIFYGRNYSGKTTLSRIIRALETGSISENYDSPSFEIEFSDGNFINQTNLQSHGKKVRVFNEDFIRENLKFITNPKEQIESFAILGDDNNKIEQEITRLERLLGNNIPGEETGLLKELKQCQVEADEAYTKFKAEQDSLDKKLNSKATDKTIGIRNQPRLYGDQNYNITKLKSEIEIVSKDDFQPIGEEKQKELKKIINQDALETIPPFAKSEFRLSELIQRAKPLLEKKILESGKIESLLKNAALNRWAKAGHALHQENHQTCGFCENHISNERWNALNRHFDEESDQLETELNALLKEVEFEIEVKTESLVIDREIFYVKFQDEFEKNENEFLSEIRKYKEWLRNIHKQLNARKNDLLNEKVYEEVSDNTNELGKIFGELENIRIQSNNYTAQLNVEIKYAQNQLRLNEIYNYLITIDYSNVTNEISKLESHQKSANALYLDKFSEVNEVRGKIEENKRLLNDEEKGAKKVNEYLTNYFGHNFLSLRAIENTDGEKRFRFEIVRDGQRAHHLSEGECSLIAFCYFMAKLYDIETNDTKPYIWIDDPISSLDGNHIFFIFSLIDAELVMQKKYEQLFVSTHSLEFLKYLKRLKGADERKPEKQKYNFFLIERSTKFSNILCMPKYLFKYVTEFNFLFEQIYHCAKTSKVDDLNFGYFYNFGNNARKFLEIYLFYKYPHNLGDLEKFKLFFGQSTIPAVLLTRINNEYSHLAGVLERGTLPIEVPEMNSTALLILERIKELDPPQYKSLLESIGVVVEREFTN